MQRGVKFPPKKNYSDWPSKPLPRLWTSFVSSFSPVHVHENDFRKQGLGKCNRDASLSQTYTYKPTAQVLRYPNFEHHHNLICLVYH